MKNVKENLVNSLITDIDIDKDYINFEKALACINNSEKALNRLEIELFNIVVKSATEFICRSKLTLIAKVYERLDSHELTRKLYANRILKAFGILTGEFYRDDKGTYYHDKTRAMVIYLKKEQSFISRIDLDEQTVKARIEDCKSLINSSYFTSLKELYSLKSSKIETNYAANFLKALLTIEKNQGKIKGKNKSAINELLEVARTLKLLPEKEEVALLDSGQANFHGKAIKKVA